MTILKPTCSELPYHLKNKKENSTTTKSTQLIKYLTCDLEIFSDNVACTRQKNSSLIFSKHMMKIRSLEIARNDVLKRLK